MSHYGVWTVMRVDEASASDADTRTRSWLECGVRRVACGVWRLLRAHVTVSPGNVTTKLCFLR